MTTSSVILLPMWPTEVSYASPVLTLSTTAASPMTSAAGSLDRHKRSHRSSSDDSSNDGRVMDGFVEEDLRAGGPNLCEPPCYSLQLPQGHALYAQLCINGTYQNDIQILGRLNGFTISDVSFVGRTSRYMPNNPPVLTALLTVHRHNPQDRGWAELARKVWGFLQDCHLGEAISVEIVDPRFTRAPYMFPCRPADEIYPIWESVCDRILRGTDLTGIHAIGCLRIGNALDPQSCVPNILVTVSRGSTRNWDLVREDILQTLMEFRLHAVGVIIRKDLPTTHSGPQTTEKLQAEACTALASLGCSLGPHGWPNTDGTLGGFLELRDPGSGQWVEFALTCFHCVSPSEADMVGVQKEDANIYSQWTRNGITPQEQDNARRLLPIDSPSQRDIRDGIERLETLVSGLKAGSYYRDVQRALDAGESVIPSDMGMWKGVRKQIGVLENSKREMERYLKDHKYRLGHVFAGSGLREAVSRNVGPNTKGWQTVRDWALVQRRNDRSFGKNDVSHLQVVCPQQIDILPPGRNIDNGEALYKVGRKTGVAHGVYTALRTAKVARQYADGAWVDKVTLEHTVMSDDRNKSFVMGGDSGALVYSLNGLVVGMCFGGQNDGELGYFTHIQDVLEDIRRVTGVKEIRLKR
ncbi:uncharacterized protein DSM5745_00325 [Aspergillus mulundensis]|uniref:Uncharacterized protein n=1 Tax=Aspergillus mulundensis TaxID=1810919 RepID=A0A3D8T375_9EURO|nr:hypothetical protein DSM5745_00325 [Aspergillus mulundensis]RDW93003.1 hypothetical protein DSM5745_00325 [Aspergillus mulundensis]